MPSFPLIQDLPEVVDSGDFDWEPLEPSGHHSTFWIGTAVDGRKWVTKLRGPEYAYREIVFARIAQQIGWSCQSSVFLKLSDGDARRMGCLDSKVHAAHWFLEEHGKTEPCSVGCRFAPLLGKPIESVEDLRDVPIEHILDWPKGDFASCLFGGNEPPGRLITSAHELVIIDSEQMFSAEPSSFSGTDWWRHAGGAAMADEVCREVASLSFDSFNKALRKPSHLRFPSIAKYAAVARQGYAMAKRHTIALR